MRDSSHDGHLLANDKSAASHGDEDLAHDDVANVDARLAELNHEGNSQYHQRHAKVKCQPFKPAAPPNNDTDNQGPEAASHVVGSPDICRFRQRQADNHLEKGREEAVPDVKADEANRAQNARAHDGPIHQQLVRDELHGRHVLLVEGKDDEKDNADNKHGNDHGGPPLLSLELVDVEGQQEQRHASRGQQQPNNIKLNRVVLYTLEGRPSGRLSRRQRTHLLGLEMVVQKEHEDRGAHHRDDDAKGPKGPSPAGAGEEAAGRRATCPRCDEKRRRRQGEEEGSVL